MAANIHHHSVISHRVIQIINFHFLLKVEREGCYNNYNYCSILRERRQIWGVTILTTIDTHHHGDKYEARTFYFEQRLFSDEWVAQMEKYYYWLVSGGPSYFSPALYYNSINGICSIKSKYLISLKYFFLSNISFVSLFYHGGPRVAPTILRCSQGAYVHTRGQLIILT